MKNDEIYELSYLNCCDLLGLKTGIFGLMLVFLFMAKIKVRNLQWLYILGKIFIVKLFKVSMVIQI